MKTKIPVLVALLAAAVLAGLAIAATPPAVPAPAPGPGGLSDDFRARLAERLNLTADQQKAIDTLRAKQRAELQTLRDAKDVTADARHVRARVIMEDYRGQIQAVLTPDQQKKAAEMRDQAWARSGRGGRDLAPHRGDERRGPAMQPGPRPNPLAVVALGERIKDRMAERLQLTDEQRDKLEHLGRAYRTGQREAAKKHRDEMHAVLTPEQQKKVDEWKQHSRRGAAGGHPPFLGLHEAAGDRPDDLAAGLPATAEGT